MSAPPQYERKEIIGHGAFALVYKGHLKQRPEQLVAIKSITKKNIAKSQALLSKEIKILQELTELQHENVVALLSCHETPTHVHLVMEVSNSYVQ
ncbi:Protein kinase domain [Trinorchestia longiramus]|nr:Protein kinase domain [Trinorchestia longiramus]